MTGEEGPPPPGSGAVLCIADDRAWCEPGIRVLIASLARHSPGLAIQLFYPPADSTFRTWLEQFHDVALNQYELGEEWRGWNIKPRLLTILLDAGYERVLWIDSDIIVTNDARRIVTAANPAELIVAEEALCSSHYDGDALRARSWGLPVGRTVPFQLNTGVVSVTRAHLPLLARWHETLGSETYRAAMKLPWDQRPLHFMGDQEVLTALLCSTEFAAIPLRLLRRGHEIIQYFGSAGYTLGERVRHLTNGEPTFIHSMGHKAWLPLQGQRGLRQRLLTLYQEVSPYRLAAGEFAGAVTDRAWFQPESATGRLLLRLAGKRIGLAGLPIALLNDAVRWTKWARTGGEPRR